MGSWSALLFMANGNCSWWQVGIAADDSRQLSELEQCRLDKPAQGYVSRNSEALATAPLRYYNGDNSRRKNFSVHVASKLFSAWRMKQHMQHICQAVIASRGSHTSYRQLLLLVIELIGTFSWLGVTFWNLCFSGGNLHFGNFWGSASLMTERMLCYLLFTFGI